MERKQEKVELRVDSYTRVCLTVIAALLTVLICGLWADGLPPARQAVGDDGIPNAGQQRKEMIDTLKQTNAKLDRLVDLFESGKARVQAEQVEPAEKTAEGKSAATRKAK